MKNIQAISHTPDQDFLCFYLCEIILSHIPMHTRLSDPHVSSLSEMSVQHRYSCEINVPHTKEDTRGQLLMQDNLHATFIAHDFISYKNKS